MESVPAVLIYDAECPVCRAAADWVRRNAAVPGAFEYLPCRSAETRSRFPSITETACLRAMHLVLPDGTILAGEKALPEILFRSRRYRRAAGLFLSLAAVPSEGTCGGEFAKPVADHVLGDEHLQMRFTVVDHERVADELGHDRASAGPRGDRVLNARLVLPLDLGEQLRVDVWTFF